ncbi:MAG: primosomal protein N' [bacterium]
MPVSSRVIQVAVPRPLHAVYDYHVPDTLPMPAIGARVKVPFARSATVGICVSDRVENPHASLKDVDSILDTEAIVPPELMALARWMSHYYHYPLGEILATVLPAAARRGAACNIAPPDHWRVCTDSFDNKRATAQAALFNDLLQKGPVTTADLLAAGHSRATLNNLRRGNYIERCEPGTTPPSETPPEPTDAQATAIAAIAAALNTFTPFLLEGVTGSGKTEVYLRSIAPVVERGQQVLVLVPEIALTPQTLSRFQRRFGQVGMLHSNLGDSARLQTWLKCAAGDISVLIGTRSAVFTPFKALGLVIVDEEHDSSYKQGEGLRYSARDLAIKRAQTHQVPVVLGSATPSLESLYNVNLDRYRKLDLPYRAGNAQMPSYRLIDMRGIQHTDGISVPLERVIRDHLRAQGQVLVFLNRRGYAPTLLCAACGWQAHCSDCDARLTLHKNPSHLVCHHCSLKFQVPKNCEGCGSNGLMAVGLGTQRTEAGLQRLFSEVPVYRIDRDTTRTNARLEAQFAKVNQGEPCIMVGTQMLAKGHHFPNVTLVAVLNADAGFASADFRAPERTAQLIVQVAGRAGREQRPGQVWIQSYQPENILLQRLINEGYPGFAAAELTERARNGFPPMHSMALLRAESAQAAEAMALLAELKAQLSGVEIMGPVPAPLARIANRSRFQLMLLAPTRGQLHAALRGLQIPKVPYTLRWSIDIDPYDSL